MPAQTVIQIRRDTAANWESTDPTLASGEIGFDTTNNQIKIGNGSDEWTVLDYASGGASVQISETAPADPDAGNVWFNSTDGRAYIYYDLVWVDLNPGIAGPDGPQGEPGIVVQTSAPTETDVLWLDSDDPADAVAVPAGGSTGQVLAKSSGTDYDTQWSTLPTPPSGNAIINGAFDIWQRGTTVTPTPSSGIELYSADRWYAVKGGSGGTLTVSRQTFTPGAAPVAGQEGQFFLRFNQSVASTGSAFEILASKIEDVRTLAGQTVTLSFYAKADTTRTFTTTLLQNFGSGGSGNVTKNQSTTINSAWQRYSFTTTLNSLTGKTIGANSFLSVEFNFESNTVKTIDLWGVQLEAGSTATPFRRNANSIEGELAACQRYFQIWGANERTMGYNASSTIALMTFPFVVEMRQQPTAFSVSSTANQFTVFHGGTQTNCSVVPYMWDNGPKSVTMAFTVSSGLTAGQGVAGRVNSPAFIGAAAEL